MPFLKTKKQRERGEKIYRLLKGNPPSANGLIATDLSLMCTDGDIPKGVYNIAEIVNARPVTREYSGFILCRLMLHKGITIVQWHGAKGGSWHPIGPFFLISKK